MSSDSECSEYSEYSDSTIDIDNDCYGRCEYGNFKDCIDYGGYANDRRFIDGFERFKKLWYATKMSKKYILVRIEPSGGLIPDERKLKTDDGDVITWRDEIDAFKCILDSAWLDTSDDGPIQYFHTFLQVHFIIHNEKLYKYDFRRTIKFEGDPWGLGAAYEFDAYSPKRYIFPDVDDLAGFVHINNNMRRLPNDDEIYTGRIIV